MKTKSVQLQKNYRHDETDAFVAINERMILNQAESVAGSEIENGWLAVGEKMLWLL